MKNWENQNFEAEWKQAFEGAEVGPSSSVWQTLDIHLIQAENITMKGRVVFYQRMAAGLVGALLLVGGYSFYKPDGTSAGQSLTQNQGTQLNGNSTTILSDSALINNIESPSAKNQARAGGRTSTDSGEQTEYKLTNSNSSKQMTQKNPFGVINTHEILTTSLNENLSGSRSNSSFEDNSPVATIYLIDVEKLPIIMEPDDISIAYRVADARPATIVPSKKKTLTPEDTWASVGIAAGSCTSAVDRASVLNSRSGISASQYYGLNSTSLSNSNSGSDEKVKSETSMSFLVSAGKRIFKRWVAQGGVSYISQTSESTTDILTMAPANETSKAILDANFVADATNLVTYSTPSEINNTIQFISVPLQAGYMLVDRKFGLQINGGLSPDFFLKNTVYNQTTKQEIVSTATGSNENYKTVSLSGLGSAEVSYRFSRHYRVSIVPGFRCTLTPIYKEDLLASAKPFVVDIGLKFRYVFDN